MLVRRINALQYPTKLVKKWRRVPASVLMITLNDRRTIKRKELYLYPEKRYILLIRGYLMNKCLVFLWF